MTSDTDQEVTVSFVHSVPSFGA